MDPRLASPKTIPTPSSPSLSSKPLCTIITPVGMLGYGLSSQHTSTALHQARISHPDAPIALILDSGSTDSGPEKLALGTMSVPREAYKRDLRKLIRLGEEFKVPVIFSSAGGSGSDESVAILTAIVKEIAAEEVMTALEVVAVYSGIMKGLVEEKLGRGMISGCGRFVPALTQDTINATTRIVAQMGPEPLLDAMHQYPSFDVLIAGRAYDPAPYIAYAAFVSNVSLSDTRNTSAKLLLGGFVHMGKILECGGLCGVPKSNGAMATVYRDGSFEVRPTDPGSRCTRISVAAHTLYEKSRPDVLYGPGGHLDLTGMRTEEVGDGKSVRVSGGVWHGSREHGRAYEVKLEGAQVVGWRSMMMGSFTDPILIGQLDSYLERVKDYVVSQHEDVEGDWELDFHVYGQHQVSTLPSRKGQPVKVLVIGEALASTQDLATNVASMARIACTHGPYPGQKATAGNFAFGICGQMDTELGSCAQFSLYHLMKLNEGEERLKIDATSPGLFRCEVHQYSAPKQSSLVGAPLIVIKHIEKSVGREELAKHATPHSRRLPLNPKTLGDIAKLIRSKNAGPYEVTLDVMFDSEAEYQLIKEANFLNAASIAKLFGLSEGEIVWQGFFDQALAYKVTIPRLRKGKPKPSGGFMESDVHASQQYIGFMNLKLSEALVERWRQMQEDDLLVL